MSLRAFFRKTLSYFNIARRFILFLFANPYHRPGREVLLMALHEGIADCHDHHHALPETHGASTPPDFALLSRWSCYFSLEPGHRRRVGVTFKGVFLAVVLTFHPTCPEWSHTLDTLVFLWHNEWVPEGPYPRRPEQSMLLQTSIYKSL